MGAGQVFAVGFVVAAMLLIGWGMCFDFAGIDQAAEKIGAWRAKRRNPQLYEWQRLRELQRQRRREDQRDWERRFAQLEDPAGIEPGGVRVLSAEQLRHLDSEQMLDYLRTGHVHDRTCGRPGGRHW